MSFFRFWRVIKVNGKKLARAGTALNLEDIRHWQRTHKKTDKITIKQDGTNKQRTFKGVM